MMQKRIDYSFVGQEHCRILSTFFLRFDYRFVGQEHCHILSTLLRFDYRGFKNVGEIESNLWIFSFDLRTLEFVIGNVE